MITTPNMKLCLALVAFLVIQCSHAAGNEYVYSAEAKIDPTQREARQNVGNYTLAFDAEKLHLLFPLKEKTCPKCSVEEEKCDQCEGRVIPNKVTALEFEVYADGPKAGFARRLGSGTFGGVFKGRISTTFNEPFEVAIKIGGQYMDCLTEASVMERFNHPALNKAYAKGVISPPAHDQSPVPRQVVVMELVNGRSLESFITVNRETRTSVQELPEEARISIVHQVANALEYMWDQEHVHGDIAPRNIMVTQKHDGIHNIVLIDFGRTVPFKEVYDAPKNRGLLSNGEDAPFNDVAQLATLCKELDLNEHAKVFPLGPLAKKSLKGDSAAFKYVNRMNLDPRQFRKHLMYSEDHPARKFLPGLLGYAVCRQCRGTGNLAVELTKPSCQACAGLRERAPKKVHDPAPQLTRIEYRRDRVWVAIIMWRQENNTRRNPAPRELRDFVKTKEFLKRTKNHPSFAIGNHITGNQIEETDIWKYSDPRPWDRPSPADRLLVETLKANLRN